MFSTRKTRLENMLQYISSSVEEHEFWDTALSPGIHKFTFHQYSRMKNLVAYHDVTDILFLS